MSRGVFSYIHRYNITGHVVFNCGRSGTKGSATVAGFTSTAVVIMFLSYKQLFPVSVIPAAASALRTATAVERQFQEPERCGFPGVLAVVPKADHPTRTLPLRPTILGSESETGFFNTSAGFFSRGR